MTCLSFNRKLVVLLIASLLLSASPSSIFAADAKTCGDLTGSQLANQVVQAGNKGPLIVFSGPSGAGKTTVLTSLLQSGNLPLRTAVAVTTRAPRAGEVNDVAYHFWTKEQFQAERAKGSFLESAEVHGNFYGTLKSEVESYRDKGMGVVLVIDVQGAQNVQKIYPDASTIFLKTSSIATYEDRLRKRGTETEESIKVRVENAAKELAHADEYQHVVINDDLDHAVSELRSIVSEIYATIIKK